MKIVPYVGDTVVSSDTVSIRVNPKDRERADDLILATSTITTVKDEHTFKRASDAMGQLKSMLNEILTSEKGAKQPFTAIVTKIGTLAKDVGVPVRQEHDRIQALCNPYIARIEQEEIDRRNALRAAQMEAERQIAEARKAADQLAMAQAQIKREAASAQLAEQKSIAPGGRVTHPWKFELVDPAATIQAGAGRLLRIEVDFLACQDAVRAQLEKDPDRVPTLPGIKVSRETKFNARATAAS